MANYDQAQSPRLGQPIPPSNTTVLFYSGEDLPEVAWHGHMIYREDTQVLQVYSNEGGWEDVTTGEFGILTFVGPEPPTSQNVGDLWFDSDDERKLYRADSIGANEILPGEWVLIRDQGIIDAVAQADAALDAAADAMGVAQQAQAVADGKITTYYESTMPATPPASLGDLWFDTDDKQAYIHDGTTFISVQDESIEQALEDAASAQSAADGKVEAYFQTSPPSSTVFNLGVGDLWYDTNDNRKPYYWNGTGWVPMPVHGDGVVDDGWEGKTITGATLRTAPGGSRMQIRNDEDQGGILESYAGVAGEVPAYINPQLLNDGSDDYNQLIIQSGAVDVFPHPSSILLEPGADTSGGLVTVNAFLFVVSADQVYLGNNGDFVRIDTDDLLNTTGGSLYYYEHEVCSATTTLTTTAADVPGCTIDVAVTSTNEVFEVIGVFDFDATTGGTGAATGTLSVELAAGTTVPLNQAIYCSPTTGGRGTVTQQWLITGVDAGTRTFKLRANRTPAGTGTYDVKSTHTSITVKRIS